jgi:hypothetical protein
LAVSVYAGKKFHQTFQYTAVEADEQIIYLAEKYVFDELKSPVEIHHGDAMQFVRDTSKQWDMICVDLLSDQIPEGRRSIHAKPEKACSGMGSSYNCLTRTKDLMKSIMQILRILRSF